VGAEALVNYEIALATCEGSRFLEEQLESLGAQTVPPSRLVVVDDASKDETLTILGRWASRANFPVLVIARPFRQGSLASFAEALTATEASYVFLCDQDDRWDPDKAEVLLERMGRLEERHGLATPLLVHSDLRLINGAGQLLHPSFHRLQKLDPKRDAFLDLALQNTVTGCATLVNRTCLSAALPFPEQAVLHDWWLAMVAARLGVLDYDPMARVSYRQHGSNVVGAAGFRQQMGRRLLELPRVWASGALVKPAITQLQACVSRYGPPELASALRRLSAYARPTRLRAALDLRLAKHGCLRTAGFYLCLALWRPQEK
jgi:glycosyltransferase involved in cell wall biosynthesis